LLRLVVLSVSCCSKCLFLGAILSRCRITCPIFIVSFLLWTSLQFILGYEHCNASFSNNFSNWSSYIKWNCFRIIKMINKTCVEHRSIVYKESLSIFDKIMLRINVFWLRSTFCVWITCIKMHTEIAQNRADFTYTF